MTESAQKLASEPDPLFTFQVLNGNFKVNASKRIGLVEVKAGDVNSLWIGQEGGEGLFGNGCPSTCLSTCLSRSNPRVHNDTA
jgi:hypothetical protein